MGKQLKHEEIKQHVTEQPVGHREVKRFLETNNEDMTYENLWNKAKEMLRGKFIAKQAFIRKEEKAHVRELER